MFKKILTITACIAVLSTVQMKTATANDIEETDFKSGIKEFSGEAFKEFPKYEVRLADENVRLDNKIKEHNLQGVKSEFRQKSAEDKFEFLMEVLKQKEVNLKTERQRIAIFQQASYVSSKLLSFEQEEADARIIVSLMEETFTPKNIDSRNKEAVIREILTAFLNYKNLLQSYETGLADASERVGKEQYLRYKIMENRISQVKNDDEWKKRELNNLNALMRGNDDVEKELAQYLEKDRLNIIFNYGYKSVDRTKHGERILYYEEAVSVLGVTAHQDPKTKLFAFNYLDMQLNERENGVFLNEQKVYDGLLVKHIEEEDRYVVDFELLMKLFGFEWTKKGNVYDVQKPTLKKTIFETLSIPEATNLLIAHL